MMVDFKAVPAQTLPPPSVNEVGVDSALHREVLVARSAPSSAALSYTVKNNRKVRTSRVSQLIPEDYLA